MSEQNEVNIALELLLEKIENLIEKLNNESEETFKSRDYEKVKSLIEDATKITDFREKVIILQKDWQTIFVPKTSRVRRVRKEEKSKKLKRGLKTPENAYRIPILESLVELGGKAKVRVVLNKVYEKMKHILNKFDKQRLPTGMKIRWHNSAQWARQKMVHKGFINPDSERGFWEITEQGREFLKKWRMK